MISAKQKRILAFPYSRYDALICDGAVRSGKTSIEVVAFIDWAMREYICGPLAHEPGPVPDHF